MSVPTIVHESTAATVWHGECIETMRLLPDASIDAVVTDPPYGLEFMGKEWDSFKPAGKISQIGKADGTPFRSKTGTPAWGASGNPGCLNCGQQKYGTGRRCECDAPSFPNHMAGQMRTFQAWCEEWAAEALRVLKPGGHILAFGGSRTWHRLAAGIEDAGFEIRDSIAWLYGSGFPKSMDVSKAIDKAAGAERPITGPSRFAGRGASGLTAENGWNAGPLANAERPDETAPATPEAEKWRGWGTALKPAFEPIVVGRKPLVGTVTANVLAHGTGALNIDASRVGTGDGKTPAPTRRGESSSWFTTNDPTNLGGNDNVGRWPTNVLLDPSQAAALDAQTGVLTSGTGAVKRSSASDTGGNRGAALGAESRPAGTPMLSYGDSGGASRFFPTFRYEAKADQNERPTVAGVSHPTVKPLALMEWLIRLVTPPGGTVLDPFLGSGTTAQAAIREGFHVVGIEREADYIPLIVHRITERDHQQSLFGEWEA